MNKDFKYKKDLVDWASHSGNVSPDSIDRWHTGEVYNKFPTKSALRKNGLGLISDGWLPESPIIGIDTRVLAVGSCFARHFILWLAEHGFNQKFPESPYNALLRFNVDFESPAVIAQQFRWAFDELDVDSLLWVDKNRNLIDATEKGKKAVRATLEQTDVLILTLGLSEVWYDKSSGEPLWRALTQHTYDPDKHVFRVETVAKTIEWLECIDRLCKKYLPNIKVIYTLSPIPLKTTFRPISAITANSVSKSIIRAALDEFLRKHEAGCNSSVFYFPSYEIVKDFFIDPFRNDNRHLAPFIPGSIIAHFARYFCAPEVISRTEGTLTDIPNGEMQEKVMRYSSEGDEGCLSRELLARIHDLEEENSYLEKVCKERQSVINDLDIAASERLDLINRLDVELKNREI